MALRYGTDASESDAFVRRRIAAPDRRPAASTARKHVVAAVGATVLAGSALLGYQASRSTTAMLRTEPATALAFDPTTYDVPTFLRHDEPIVVFAGDANSICLDDGSARKSALSTVTARACRATSVDQVFVYDDQHLMLKSAKKRDLCLSDGGATQPGDGPVHMALCDVESPDQRFVYDEGTVAFRNPTKNLCLSNGGGASVVGATFKMDTCNPDDAAQVFRILWQNEVGGPVDEYVEDTPVEETVNTPEPIVANPQNEEPSQPVEEQGEQPTYGEPAPSTEEQPSYEEPAPATEGETPATSEEEPMVGGVPNPMYEEPSQPVEEQGEQPTYGEPAPATEEQPSYGEPAPATEEQPTYGEPAPATEGETPLSGEGELPVVTSEEAPTPYVPVVDAALPEAETAAPEAEVDDLASDWNLLAPSHQTIGSVNADASPDVTSDEIFAYLTGIKVKAEEDFELTISKYDRTTKCVTAGLESFAKTSLTESEYHALVAWMYKHCTAWAAPNCSGCGTQAPTADHIYMTKLEFYYKIKDHFAAESAELTGQAQGARLRSEIGTTMRQKLEACIEAASNRFGRDTEYAQPEHFHNAIQWVQDECMNAASR